jgi:membrane associated rhomboid family serine protease
MNLAPTESHKPFPRALLALVLVIAAIECLLSAADAGFIGDPTLRIRFLQTGAFWTPLLHGATPIFALQPYTMFLSHALLHGGMLHMVMNMVMLLALGRFIADRYGDGVILPLFFVGAVAGGAAYGLLSTSAAPMVGASGADFAFIGVWSVWDLRRHRAAGLSARPVWTRVGVLVALNVAMYIGLSGMLAWQAHLGGFLAGCAYGVVLENRFTARALAARAAARRGRGEPGGE